MTDLDKGKLTREELEAPRAVPARHGAFRRILTLALTLLVVLGIVMAAAYFDLTNFDSLRRALNYQKTTTQDGGHVSSYAYDNDRSNLFAMLGDRLLVVSTTRIDLLSDDGTTVYSAPVKFTAPAIALGGRTAAVYDVGGTSLYILGEKGLVEDLSAETGSGVLSARLNSSDFLALVTEKSGYKSAVSIYNASFERVFTFNSSNHYIVDACCERDGRHAAIVTLGENDGSFESTVYRYALDQEAPVSSCAISDTLLYEIDSLGGTLVAVTDDRFVALADDGSLCGSYEYSYPYLRGSTLSGADFGALVLSRYRSGSAGRIVTVGADGNMLASVQTQRDVLDISASGRYLAVLYSDELVIYTPELEEYATLDDTQYARGVLMRQDGTALLLGASEGWLFVP